jgi:hypothetical protein
VGVVIHATPRGLRNAAAVSETVIDGAIAAFHAGLGRGPAAADAAAALTPRFPTVAKSEIEDLVAESLPGPPFISPAFAVRGNYMQISPCDERCQTGEVIICPDADGPYPQISGELYALRPAPGKELGGHRNRAPYPPF